MKTEKMTIHRALAELKLIDSRIEKGIKGVEPTGIMQEEKLVNGIYEKNKFNENAKSKVQSVLDLIDRKNKIKSAIVKANGNTEVDVSGHKMLIADAINLKYVIEFKKQLIVRLLSEYNSSKANAEHNNAEVDNNALRLAEAALQKDHVKIGDNDAVAITEPFITKNKFHLVDPLNVEEFTDKLQSEVDDFETEIDAVLSEINAITVIKI